MSLEQDDLKQQLESAEAARRDLESQLETREGELRRLEIDLRTAQGEVETANRAKNLFLSRMSHEIRTPINAVIGMTRMALESEVSEEQRHFLTTVKNTSETLISLVNNVLDYSKIEVGELDMEAVDFDLRYLVGSVMDRVVSRVTGKRLEPFCLVDAGVPLRLAGDPTRLRQILINLLGNAVKFTDRGEVVLRVGVEGEDEAGVVLAFSVTDSGAGIPPERLARIFDVFMTAEGPGRQEFNRAGLGLSISRQLVEMMGGEMTVESEVGRGSTFHFTARFEKPAQARERPAVSCPVAGTSVLMVSPAEIPRRALCGMLTFMGLLTREAGTGAEALAALRQAAERGEPLPLVLADNQLSDMDAAEMARRIRAHPLIRETRLIILSSHGTRGEVNQYRQAGVDGYLIKPVSRSVLFNAVSVAVTLPADRGAERVMITRHSLEELKSRRAWVLLAEADPEEQKQVVRMLRGRGLQVGIAANGLDALTAASTSAWDLLLIGFHLPVMGGPDAARAIREREAPSARRLPIIAMMSEPSAMDMDVCLSAGMDGYLTRPLAADQLWNTMKRWLKPVPGKPGAGRTTAPAVRPEVFDLEPVLKRHDRNMEFIRELADIFLTDTPRGLRELEVALRRKDWALAERLARGMKGACENFGVAAMGKCFAEIQTCCSEGRLEAAVNARDAADRLFASVETALGKFVG